MESLRDKIVTLASMRPTRAQAESQENVPEANTPEAELKIARYYQIMQRLQQETEDIGSDDVLITVPDREVSLAQSKLAMEAAAAQPLPSGGQEVKFGTGLSGGDWLRWMLSLADWVDRRDAHAMLRPKAAKAASDLPNGARIAITADWGTGLYGAPKIAESIRSMAAQQKFDLVMHLGDVYYSGTKEEVKDRFIDVWPLDAGTRNRALNGNHEMYSGGFGYFELILPAFGQEASYFAMQNDHWLLVGLDTAYVDHDIDNAQVAWLTLLVQAAQSRKVVLFSHQQPFSRLDHQGPKLQKALRHLLESKAITAWYWGHEHECIIYDAHREWGLFGRCLGNGGIPSARKSQVKQAPVDGQHPGGAACTWRRLDASGDAPGCIVLDGPNSDMKKKPDQEKFGPHGFMTLDLVGTQLVERVFLSNGTELFSNTIT